MFLPSIFTRALFNGVSELEIGSRYLYVADIYNYRIRRVDLQTRAVDTVLGGGPQSKSGLWGFNAVNALNAGVGRLSGMGLSRNEQDLYVTMMTQNAVGVVRNVNSPGESKFVYICGINIFNARSTVPQGICG